MIPLVVKTESSISKAIKKYRLSKCACVFINYVFGSVENDQISGFIFCFCFCVCVLFLHKCDETFFFYSTISSINTHFNTFKKKALGKHFGKR